MGVPSAVLPGIFGSGEFGSGEVLDFDEASVADTASGRE